MHVKHVYAPSAVDPRRAPALNMRIMPAPKRQPRKQWKPTYLRAWRLYRKMTQEQAAPLLEVDYTTLGKIERGRVPYSQPLLEAAASLYRCTTGDLLGADPFENDRAKGRAVDLTEIIRNAPPEVVAELTGYLRGRYKDLLPAE